MCVGVPGKVILKKGKKAKIKQGDHYHWVDLSSLNEAIKEGDYLITYQGVAINKISNKEAQEIFNLMDSASNTRIKGSN